MKLLSVLSLILMTNAGCLVVPYGYPSWSRTPELSLSEPDETSIALRVIASDRVQSNFKEPGPYSYEKSQLVGLVEPTQGQIPSSNALLWHGGKVGFLYVPMLYMFAFETNRQELWVYRPTYEMAIIPHWSDAHSLPQRRCTSYVDEVANFRKLAAFDGWKAEDDFFVGNECYVRHPEKLNDKRQYFSFLFREATRLLQKWDEKCLNTEDHQWLQEKCDHYRLVLESLARNDSDHEQAK